MRTKSLGIYFEVPQEIKMIGASVFLNHYDHFYLITYIYDKPEVVRHINRPRKSIITILRKFSWRYSFSALKILPETQRPQRKI